MRRRRAEPSIASPARRRAGEEERSARLWHPRGFRDGGVAMAMSEKQKMLAGELYYPGDPEILADQAAAKAWMVRYNAALAASPDERRALLAERLAAVGAGAVIRPPFHCDYGYNIHLGEGAFLNFNCVILDVVAVHIGRSEEHTSELQSI